ncbi:AAA family ATPase [Alkalihalobacillus hemicellulosilyticus]|uniref:Gluconokinase n=1 Tax=Halalkalibacter hemicellulosilyticusJCM 9152 TaxID=1236971 RepID=W4QHQ3_9BACI|nr:AAA family ATPase [Halalkalibacter hemicellulosilyticus]GAE31188.1 hypothetical protein JCM9152_2639 [Halalkalibacter hemicellulosilyticusJCM 9152]
MRRIYIITGPAGVGKSTISKRLVEQFTQSAYIEGDLINHMIVGGYLPPWESEELLTLTWENIASLATNFLRANKDVVIDYIAYPEDVEKVIQKVRSERCQAKIFYVVLWVDHDELLRRDQLRDKQYQMGQRCLDLVKEFKSKQISERYYYHTNDVTATEVVEKIRKSGEFIVNEKIER